ncbi:MAG: hypothetical protein RLZZ338_1538 [Cyanobacteriota bacterium]
MRISRWTLKNGLPTMRTYTAIILTLLSLGFSVKAQAITTAHAADSAIEASTNYHGMMSAETDNKFDRKPERGSGRRDFVDTHVPTQIL